MGVRIKETEDGLCEVTVYGELGRRLQKAARDLKTTPEALALAAIKAKVSGDLEIEKGRKEVRRAHRRDK